MQETVQISRETWERMQAENAHLKQTLEAQTSRLQGMEAETEVRFRSLLHALPVSILVFDPNAAVTLVNQAACRLLGRTEGQIIGRTPYDPDWEVFDLTGNRLPAESMTVPQVFANRRPVYGRVIGINRRDNGERVWVLASAEPMLTPEGEIELVVETLSDITETKQVEAALRESEARFRAIFASAAIGIALVDNTQGHPIESNRALQTMLGYSAEELASMSFVEFTHPEDVRLDWGLFQEMADGKRSSYQIEKRFFKKDGSLLWGRLTASMIRNGRGMYNYAIGMVEDITERKRAEEALRVIIEGTSTVTGADFFRSLVRHLASALQVRYALVAESVADKPDRMRTLAFWSGEDFGADFEYTLAGTPCENVMERTLCYYPHSVQERFPLDAELVTMGVEAYLGTPLFDREGKPLGLLAVMHDAPMQSELDLQGIITTFAARAGAELERLHAVKALQQREGMYRAAIATADGVVYQTDRATDTYTYMDERIESLIGYPMEEVTPAIWRQIILSSRLRGALEGMSMAEANRRFLAGEIAIWTADYECRTRSGESRWLADSAIPLHDSVGNVSGALGILQDITDRKRTEESLQTSLEQLHILTSHLQSVREEERARVAREVHDELGQALTGLKIDLAWLKRNMLREHEEASQEELQVKFDGMNAAIEATIKAVRRIATELRPAILDMLGLVPALEWLTQDFQERTGILCDFRSNLEEAALSQERMIAVFRICQESLTNVSRHAGATRVRVRLNAHAKELTLTVQDNGKGISAAAQASSSFGLFSMRERAMLLGGEVQIEGASEKGTKVMLRLPMQETE